MAAMLDLYSIFTRAWLQPMRPLSSALVLSGTRVPRPKFVQPGCTATATRSENVGLARRLEAGPGEYAQFAGWSSEWSCIGDCDSVAAPRQRRFYLSEFQAALRCIAALSGVALPRLWNEIVPGGPPSPSS